MASTPQQQAGGAIVALLLLLGLFAAANQPKPPASTAPTTTLTTSTTTTPATSTTVAGPSRTLRPSGGDDTAAFIAAVTAGNVVVDGPLVINEIAAVRNVADRTITFTQNGSLQRTVRSPLRKWQVLVLNKVQRFTINNLRIVGPNIEVCDFVETTPGVPNGPVRVGYFPKYEAQHGLEIDASTDITVNGANIYGLTGDGVYLAGAAANIVLNDVTTKCTGRSSISNVGSVNVTVNRGSFSEAGRWIFNVEPDLTAVVDRYTINQPTVGYSVVSWLFSGGPYFSCKVTNVSVNQPRLNTTSKVTVAPCVAAGVKVNP